MEIVVQVRLNALLRKHARDGKVEFPLEASEGCSIEDLIAQMGIPSSEVGFATVNLRYTPLTRVLETGDRVILFSPLAGG